MTGSLLVTGATGMLGRELIPQLLVSTDAQLVLLARRERRAAGTDRLIRGVLGITKDASRSRIRAVYGDIEAPGLGLTPAVLRGLRQEVTGMLHAAAATRFDQPLRSARRTNVTGTRNAVAFARSCERLDRFGLVSTVYVSGRRSGHIRESERAHDAGFANTYERTKYEAEGLVEAETQIPSAIYRLSTLIGSSITGRTTHFTVPHKALRLMHLGLVPAVSGDPGCLIDLLPTDIAARAVTQLFLRERHERRTFHIVAGEQNSFTLAEVIDASWAAFSRHDPAWREHPKPKPLIVPTASFDRLVAAVTASGDPVTREVIATLAPFIAQLSHPKRFDMTALTAALPSFAATVPSIREVYPKVVAHCLRTSWGRSGC